MTKLRGLAVLAAVLLFFGGLGTLGVLAVLGQIQQGRAVAVRVTCAVMTAVAQSGRDVIANSAQAPETPFTRRLEKLGYPPPAVRRVRAERAADAYVVSLNRHVITAVGVERAQNVVLPGGRINCEKVLRLARTR